jgi:phage virion morphogenesis protein
MATGFKVKVEDEQVKRALQRVIKATGDLTPAMKAIGEHMLRSTGSNFAGEHEPDGTPWKPLKVLSYHLAYALRKGKATHTRRGRLTAGFQKYLAGRKILTDSGELRGSIAYRAGGSKVEWGTGKVYGAIHQFGGQAGRNKKVTIPARPFLGVGPDDRSEIVNILENHLRAAISG